MTPEEITAYAAVVVVILTIISWFVSSWQTKRSLSKMTLKYHMHIDPILVKGVLSEPDGLKIEYKGEDLTKPYLLSVDIYNTGNKAIANPPIEVSSTDATYVIPGYFEDIPGGYEDQWKITREETGPCKINLSHINPGQIAKARFLLDNMPEELPKFICPMQDVKVLKYEPVKINPILKALLGISNPTLLSEISVSIKR